MTVLIEVLQLIASLATIGLSAVAIVGSLIIWPTARQFGDYLFEFED